MCTVVALAGAPPDNGVDTIVSAVLSIPAPAANATQHATVKVHPFARGAAREMQLIGGGTLCVCGL